MFKPTLCFALPFEAKPWIKEFGAKAVSQSKQIGLYSSIQGDILITGIGTYKMSAAIGWLFGKGDAKRVLFNIGLCGTANFPVYSWLHPHSVVTPYQQHKPFYPEILFKGNLSNTKLLTIDEPATTEYLKNFENTAVDMEGYAFAKSALQFIPLTQIHLLKFVSDNGADQELDLNLIEVKYSQTMYTAIEFIEKTCRILNKDYTKKELVFKENQLIADKLKLTFSQKVQLDNALRYVYFYGLENRLKEMPDLINQKIKDKYQRNLLFNEVLNKLYHA